MGSDGLESAGLSEKLTRTISALGMVAAQEKSKIANKNTAIISFLFKIITLYSFFGAQGRTRTGTSFLTAF